MANFRFPKKIVFDFDGDAARAEAREIEYEALVDALKACATTRCVITNIKVNFWSCVRFDDELRLLGIRVRLMSRRVFQTASPNGLVINFSMPKRNPDYAEDLILNATQHIP